MPGNEYRLFTQWCFLANIVEVAAILEDVGSLSRWWPMVHLRAEVTAEGNPDGIGRRVKLLTRGRLPYCLDWEFVVVESNSPHRVAIEAFGDLSGTGAWDLRQAGEVAEVDFTWVVRAEKPVLRTISWAVKPLLVWNHRWAMDRGQECLCAELKRRRRSCAPTPPTAAD